MKNNLRSSSEIVDIIKKRMNELGLNQKELALKTGISTSAISRYFNGSREFPVNDAPKFASALSLELSYLIGLNLDNSENKKRLTSIDDLDFTGINRIAAHFSGDDFSEEDLNEIQSFINYVKQKNKNKEK